MGMMNVAVRALALAGVALACALPMQYAQAETHTLLINNGHPYRVQLELYSQDRNHVWPGNGQAYVLDDDETKEVPIQCRSGETICYGAWVDGDSDTYWGVGPDDVDSCEACCFVCAGGETEEIQLVE